MVHQRTEQPGAVDLGIRIHAEDADQFISIIGHNEAIRRRNHTFGERRADIRLAFTEEANMVLSGTVEASNKSDKFVKAVPGGKKFNHRIMFISVESITYFSSLLQRDFFQQPRRRQ